MSSGLKNTNGRVISLHVAAETVTLGRDLGWDWGPETLPSEGQGRMNCPEKTENHPSERDIETPRGYRMRRSWVSHKRSDRWSQVQHGKKLQEDKD